MTISNVNSYFFRTERLLINFHAWNKGADATFLIQIASLLVSYLPTPSISVYRESEDFNLYRKPYLTNQWTMLSCDSLIDWLSQYAASSVRWFLLHKQVGLLNLTGQRYQCHSKTIYVHVSMFKRSTKQYFVNEQNKLWNYEPAFFILYRRERGVGWGDFWPVLNYSKL